MDFSGIPSVGSSEELEVGEGLVWWFEGEFGWFYRLVAGFGL